MTRGLQWLGGALSLSVAACLVASCAAASAPPAEAKPGPGDAATAESSDASTVAPKSFPPPPADFPVMAITKARLEYLREDPIDPEWAPQAKAALEAHLTKLDDPSVRVVFVECRTRTCFVAMVRASGSRGAKLPVMPWTGAVGSYSKQRVDGSEGLLLHYRHPKDYPDVAQRVSSFAGALEDPNCKGGQVKPRDTAPSACRGMLSFPTYLLCFQWDPAHGDLPCECHCSLGGYTRACSLLRYGPVCTGKPESERSPSLPDWFSGSYP